MKLRNKKTGEIVEITMPIKNGDGWNISANSLAELNEDWKDYEEPKDKGYWYIDDFGRIQFSSELMDEIEGRPNNWIARKLFGNYFETREEAERVVEKLKAWKRLKDKGFRFTGWTIDDGLRISICSNIDEEDIYDEDKRKIKPDLDLLFGGEE